MVFALRSDVRRRPDLGQQAGHLFLAIAPWGGHFILPRLHLLVQLHLDQRRRLDVSAQCSDGRLGDPAQPRFLEPGDVFLQVVRVSSGLSIWRAARRSRIRPHGRPAGRASPDLRPGFLALLPQGAHLLDVAGQAVLQPLQRLLAAARQLVVAARPQAPWSRDEGWPKPRLLSAEPSTARR